MNRTAPPASDITEMGAVALSAAIASRTVSRAEGMTAYLARIGRLNPQVDAIVALRERAELMREAEVRSEEIARGPLHGFPLDVKEPDPVRGLPFTQGSPIFRDRIVDTDSIMVERMRASGEITGKTDTPGFGLGSQTYNPVCSAARNTYDPSRTSGGSSGGAAYDAAARRVELCRPGMLDGRTDR